MATPTPGTIPALTQYQPGALPLAGTEAFEIVNSTNATAAASYFLLVTDAVGKAPGVMADQNPTGSDMFAFYRPSTGEYFSGLIGNLNVPAGNLPVGGATGTLLQKQSGTNYDATWTAISSMVAGQTGIVGIAGSTSLVISIEAKSLTGAQIATNAIGSTEFRQSVGLSVVGVAGTATANVADITATAGTQVLQSNAGGTGILWTSVINSLPGPLKVTTLGIANVLLGAGTAAMTSAAPTAPGALLIDQGTTSNPLFRAVAGDLVMSLNGTATVTTNAITYAKIQQGTGLSVMGVAGTANANFASITGGTGMVLAVAASGTSLAFSGAPYIATSLVVGVSTAVATGVILANTYLRSLGGFKATTTTLGIVSSTTLVNATALSVSLLTASTYMFQAALFFTSGSTGGAKIAINSSGTASNVIYDAQCYAGGALVGQARATALGGAISFTSPVTPTVTVLGSVVTNNAGTLSIQIAQVAATTTSTILMAGSTLQVVQVS